jgi:predicted ester cyclase
MSTQTPRSESNRRLVESFNEAVFVDNDFDRLEEYVAPDVVQIEAGEKSTEGIEALQSYFEEMLEDYEDIEMSVDSIISDDEHVMYRFGMSATARRDFEIGGEEIDARGKPLEWGGFVDLTIENDRIVEVNVLTDEAALYRQLGVLPRRSA